MNPAIPALVSAALEIWRIHANKPPGWTPSAEDWNEMRRLNGKTAEDYEREALGNAERGMRSAESPNLGEVMATASPGNTGNV